MANLVVFLVAVLAFQVALVAAQNIQGEAAAKKIKEEVASPAIQKTELEKLAHELRGVVNDVSNKLNSILPDSKQINDAFARQSQIFAESVQDITKKLQSEINTRKDAINDLLKPISEKLTENVQALRQVIIPNATAKADEIKAEFGNRFRNAATEIENLVQTVQSNAEKAGESVNDLAKGILDDFLKAAELLKDAVDDNSPKPAEKPSKQ